MDYVKLRLLRSSGKSIGEKCSYPLLQTDFSAAVFYSLVQNCKPNKPKRVNNRLVNIVLPVTKFNSVLSVLGFCLVDFIEAERGVSVFN